MAIWVIMLIEVMPQMGDETKGSDKAKINKKAREGVLSKGLSG